MQSGSQGKRGGPSPTSASPTLHPQSLDEALKYCNYVFTIVFVFEAALKLVAFGFRRFFKDRCVGQGRLGFWGPLRALGTGAGAATGFSPGVGRSDAAEPRRGPRACAPSLWPPRWNQLDLAIVLLSLMGITLEEIEMSAALPINPTIIRIMRVLRIARGRCPHARQVPSAGGGWGLGLRWE